MTDARQAFLAGDRPDDVALYLAEGAVDDLDALEEYGTRVEDGMVLVMDGETGRSVFQRATKMEAMAFAGRAMQTTGAIEATLTGGTCPKAPAGDQVTGGADEPDGSADAPDAEDHRTRFVFAFVETQNDEVDGLVAEGDTVFAYAHCTCGAAYSDRWLTGERSDPDEA